jgi:hypothetical protein
VLCVTFLHPDRPSRQTEAHEVGSGKLDHFVREIDAQDVARRPDTISGHPETRAPSTGEVQHPHSRGGPRSVDEMLGELREEGDNGVIRCGRPSKPTGHSGLDLRGVGRHRFEGTGGPGTPSGSLNGKISPWSGRLRRP